MRPEIKIYDQVEALSRAAADIINKLAGRVMAERDRFYLLLSGGSTPLATYRLLGEMWKNQAGILSGLHLFWGDDRLVPPDDSRSNYGQAMTALAGLGLAPGRVHRIPTELGPDETARAYERELTGLGLGRTGGPFFDCVLLGLGQDGHTASLFPKRASLDEKKRLVVPEPEPGLEPFVSRITLTLPALNSARETIFLAAGADKALAVNRCVGPEARPDRQYPASLIRPAEGRLAFMLDKAAWGGIDFLWPIRA